MDTNHSHSEKRFDFGTLQSVLSDLSHFIAIERLGPKVTQRICWRAPIAENKIALTFDDGPQPTYTPRLLKILHRFDVPATFFMIGKHLSANKELAKDVVEAGHEPGNHTYSHQLMFRFTNNEMTDEIRRTDDLLCNLDGQVPRFLRPPMGLFSKRVLDVVEKENYHTVVGDVYPRDPHLPGKEKILTRVLHRTIKGSIIILHDGGNSKSVDRTQTLWAVERIIPQLQDSGFEFVTLSGLITRDCR